MSIRKEELSEIMRFIDTEGKGSIKYSDFIKRALNREKFINN